MRIEWSIGKKNGEFEGEVHGDQEASVGREAEWFSVPDTTVSRVHFVFFIRGNELWFRDNASRNGVFFNKQKKTEGPVGEGDTIQVGRCKIRIRSVQSLQESAAPVQEAVSEEVSNQGQSNLVSPQTRAKNQPQIMSAGSNLKTNKAMGGAYDLFFDWEEFVDDPKAVLQFYKDAVLGTRAWLDSLSFEGSVASSLAVVAISSTLSGVLQALINLNPGLLIFLPLMFCIYFVVASLFIAGLMHMTRGWRKSEGGFENYLRLTAYMSIIAVPVVPLSSVFPLVGSVLLMAYSFFVFYCFLTAFKQNRFRTGVVYFSPMLVPMLIVFAFVGFKATSGKGFDQYIKLLQRAIASQQAQMKKIDRKQEARGVASQQKPAQPQQSDECKNLLGFAKKAADEKGDPLEYANFIDAQHKMYTELFNKMGGIDKVRSVASSDLSEAVNYQKMLERYECLERNKF